MARHKPLKSSATNAYDLLKDVCAVILEEPKRYHQEVWRVTDREHIQACVGDVPSCGTLACRAGWIVQLRDGRGSPDSVRIRDRAYAILGTEPCDSSAYQADVLALFSGAAVFRANDKARPGTRAYAREGVRGVREFMAKHKARLKAITFPKR